MAIHWFKKNKSQKTGEAPAETTDRVEKTASSKDAKERFSEEPSTEEKTPSQEKTAQKGLFGRLRRGLRKTRELLTTDIDDLFLGKKELDEALLEELEERLITADLGVQTAMALIDRISNRGREISGPAELRNAIREEMLSMIGDVQTPPPAEAARPRVVLVLGVNGVGKTTTIGKLAARAAAEGQKVLIAAADTFRAAAVEQLEIWARRAGADFVRHKEGADPAAVAFDGIDAALARNIDMVLIDTAGRLHTKVNLMEELKKIKRSIAKKLPEAPHETLLVLDATTGQNALSQAELFQEEIGVTGLVMTKLDGTAKGGVVVAVCSAMKVPLRYIGVGEQIDDLQPFEPQRFLEALLY
ncbi:MAG: signal recognition particle-docking protein FtsY [Desulfobacterales bacterium]|jgi:fused signal recognition particle receptor